MPLLKDASRDWRESVFFEYFHEKVASHVPVWKALRTEKWKYIEYELETTEMNELYELENDPKEEFNIYLDDRYDLLVSELKAEMQLLQERLSNQPDM